MKAKGYHYVEVILDANDAGSYNWTLHEVLEDCTDIDVAYGVAASPHLAFIKAQEALTDSYAVDERYKIPN